MGRLITLCVISTLLVGCTSVPPTPTSSTVVPPVSASTWAGPPSPIREEVARDLWSSGARTTTPGEADLGNEQWVASGRCDGGGDLAVTYTVTVDGTFESGGTIVCSMGVTYTNSAIQPRKGKHRVEVMFGPEVVNTNWAYIRIIPTRLVDP